MFMSLNRTHCRNAGISAEMLWVRLCSNASCGTLHPRESMTSGFNEVGMGNAMPNGTRLSMCRRTFGTMNAYTVDARDQPRFKMETDIRVYSRSCGLLEGRTVDISKSGIAAMLALEAPVGEMVELEFTLPSERVAIHAIVRQKNAFRYGFEFVDSDSLHGVIRRTCRDLALTKLCSAGCETQLSEASLPCL